MATVHFLPVGKKEGLSKGTTILQAARQAGITIEAPCNGSGTCGKCKVRIGKDFQEENALEKLACQTQIEEDAVVWLPEKESERLKIVSEGKSFSYRLKPNIRKEFEASKNVTLIRAGEESIGFEEGDTTDKIYGIVVDIGTTTLVAALFDLRTGEELASVSALNPQSLHGQDVLSRITLASDKEGLKLLYECFTEELSSMLETLTLETGVSPNHIYEVIYSGNTCMLHLATCVSPYTLGRYPYVSLVPGASYLKARDYGLKISPFGIIYLPPNISAYVGADITSGILASKLYETREKTLLIDIGTNGEMVINIDGDLFATSTAAGPAFEGMNIACGMRAGAGAIERFSIDEQGNVSIKTIGNKKACGICGSGLIDIVGELVRTGVIGKNGRFKDSKILPSVLSERLVSYEGKTVFKITDDVFLSQKDIRQVQLAKGAIRAGVEFLIKSKGLQAKEVDKVLIAGSFGYHLRAQSLIDIGLLPQEFKDKIEFIGNTSKSGAAAFLLNADYRTELEKAVKKIKVLELANFKDFDRVFVSSLNF